MLTRPPALAHRRARDPHCLLHEKLPTRRGCAFAAAFGEQGGRNVCPRSRSRRRHRAPRTLRPGALLCRRGMAWLTLLAAACCGVAPAAAEAEAGVAAERVREVRFEPARFVAGDPVVARIVVHGAADLTAPDAVAGDDWLSVHDVEVLTRTDGSWEVRVRFTSYRPGVGELPPVDVGPFQLTGIGFLTSSVLPRYGEVLPALRAPAPQMAVPGTAALLIGGSLAVLVVPYPLVSGVLLLAGAGRRLRARRARTRPRMVLERAVQRLQASDPGGVDGAGSARVAGDPVSFYARLARLARGYLGERLALPAHAMTVGELRAALPEQGLPHGLGADLTAILEAADRVKFSGGGAAAEEMQAAARQLVTLARAVDAVLEERAAHRRGARGVEL